MPLDTISALWNIIWHNYFEFSEHLLLKTITTGSKKLVRAVDSWEEIYAQGGEGKSMLKGVD